MIRREVAPGIIQITLDEHRWYIDEDSHYPSVTWILESYPKNVAFHKYLASMPDFETSQRVMKDAGNRGSKVHAGIEKLLHNEKLSINDIMPEHYEPFTAKEWQYILTFMNWWEKYKPIVLGIESNVIHKQLNYAGTIDLYCEIDGIKTVIDWKTSANIYESYKCQIAAYAFALLENDVEVDQVGIVRLGSRHKIGYEFWQPKDFEELEKYFDLFQSVKKIWAHENPDPHPRFIDVQEEIQLTIKQEEEDVAKKYEDENIGGSKGKDQDGNEGQIRSRKRDSKEPGLF